MKKKIVFLVAFVLSGGFCSANPAFLKVIAADQSVRIYEKYELTMDLNARYTNPFDYDQITLKGVFQSPSGKKFTVDGFYYEDFTYSCNPSTFDEGLKDSGSHHWKIRFTPFETGSWKVTLSCTDLDGTTTYPDEMSFTCLTGDHSKGFIRKANSMYLKYDNGDFYFPINMNAGWCEATNTTICSYKDWIDEFSENGGNNLRLLANSYWGISIEKREHDNLFTPGNYTAYMKQAYRMDCIMEYASQKGVNIDFVMDNHVLYNCRGDAKCYFRQENPYYSGHLDHSVYPYGASSLYDCFRISSREPYKTLIKWQTQRTRYMIARWGYAANLSAWEIMGEVELLDSLKNNPDNISVIMDYVKYMISFIKKTDIYGHLITISGGGEKLDADSPPTLSAGIQYQMFSFPGIDFVSHHKYSVNSFTNGYNYTVERLPAFIGDLIPYTLQIFNKPVEIDESLWPDRHDYPNGDPKGYLCHNLLWTSVFSGSMGTANVWDWVPVLFRAPAPYNKYFCPGYLEQIRSVSTYMKNLNLLDQKYTPNHTEGDNDPYRCYYLTGGTKVYGYVQNKEYDWETIYMKHKPFLMDARVPDAPVAGYLPVSIPQNTSCKIQVGNPGSYKVTFYTCDSKHQLVGMAMYTSKREHRENVIEIQLPRIDWDMTFVAEMQ